jgi:hypothetical protein
MLTDNAESNPLLLFQMKFITNLIDYSTGCQLLSWGTGKLRWMGWA